MNRRHLTVMTGLAIALLLWAAATVIPTIAARGAPDGSSERRTTGSFNGGDGTRTPLVSQRSAPDSSGDPARTGTLARDRVQPRASTVKPAHSPGAPAAIAQPIGTSLNAHRTPHPVPKPGEVLDITIKQLGNFDYDPDGDTAIPPDVRALDGHAVRLRGFMVPLDQAANITRFALVPSLFTCCYGQPPQVQHTVVVICPNGAAVSYYPEEVVVLGQLTVSVVSDDGFVVSLFSVEASSVRAAATAK